MLVEVDDVGCFGGVDDDDVDGAIEDGDGVHGVIVGAQGPTGAREVNLVDNEDGTVGADDGLEGVGRGEDGPGVAVMAFNSTAGTIRKEQPKIVFPVVLFSTK